MYSTRETFHVTNAGGKNKIERMTQTPEAPKEKSKILDLNCPRRVESTGS
jgi:hypothetical protein